MTNSKFMVTICIQPSASDRYLHENKHTSYRSFQSTVIIMYSKHKSYPMRRKSEEVWVWFWLVFFFFSKKLEVMITTTIELRESDLMNLFFISLYLNLQKDDHIRISIIASSTLPLFISNNTR